MYLADLEKKIIHDMSFIRFECDIKKIPEDKRKKLYGIITVKTMFTTEANPRFNGCQYCMSEYHVFDFNTLFR